MAEKWLTLRKAAARLRISETQLRQEIADGKHRSRANGKEVCLDFDSTRDPQFLPLGPSTPATAAVTPIIPPTTATPANTAPPATTEPASTTPQTTDWIQATTLGNPRSGYVKIIFTSIAS